MTTEKFTGNLPTHADESFVDTNIYDNMYIEGFGIRPKRSYVQAYGVVNNTAKPIINLLKVINHSKDAGTSELDRRQAELIRVGNLSLNLKTHLSKDIIYKGTHMSDNGLFYTDTLIADGATSIFASQSFSQVYTGMEGYSEESKYSEKVNKLTGRVFKYKGQTYLEVLGSPTDIDIKYQDICTNFSLYDGLSLAYLPGRGYNYDHLDIFFEKYFNPMYFTFCPYPVKYFWVKLDDVDIFEGPLVADDDIEDKIWDDDFTTKDNEELPELDENTSSNNQTSGSKKSSILPIISLLGLILLGK